MTHDSKSKHLFAVPRIQNGDIVQCPFCGLADIFITEANLDVNCPFEHKCARCNKRYEVERVKSEQFICTPAGPTRLEKLKAALIALIRG